MIINIQGPMSYVLITPIKAKYIDTEDSIKICARIISDNLASSCQLYWELQDELGNKMISGNSTIAGDEYANWNGASEPVFEHLLTELNLELLPEIE